MQIAINKATNHPPKMVFLASLFLSLGNMMKLRFNYVEVAKETDDILV